ncbi:hypothetical protein LZ554_008174 [Drepanopeziza brunnea f. sp. 'monogermtubi']|nr:hypothetical protein LZ554_008174 [Drepanopeziza brunnea f. sp. 'monogermtubi']
MLRSKSALAILLASIFPFSRAQGIFSGNIFRRETIIGYAVVSEEEAERINYDNKLHIEEYKYLNQLGSGFYMVNQPDNWLDGEEWSWYCVIRANKKKLANIDKVYVPESYQKMTSDGRMEEQSLVGGDDEFIVEYIKSETGFSDPEAALRFTWVQGSNWHLQMAVPTKVVDGGHLGEWAKCFKTRNEMEVSDDAIDWQAWKIKKYREQPDIQENRGGDLLPLGRDRRYPARK